MSITESEFSTMVAPMLEEMVSGVGIAAEAWFKVMGHMEMHRYVMKEGEPEEGWLAIINSLSLITTILCSLAAGLVTTGSAEATPLADKALKLNDHFVDNLVALQRYRRQR